MMQDVIAYIKGDIVEAELEWGRNGPRIHASGETFEDDIRYRRRHAIGPLSSKGQDFSIELSKEYIIDLKPIRRYISYYSIKADAKENVYPPSTLHWYSHTASMGRLAAFYIQKTDLESKLWLTIIDYKTENILFSHPINFYEGQSYWGDEAFQTWLNQKTEQWKEQHSETLSWFDDLLAAPAPSWEQLAKLVADAPVRNLEMGNDMRGTLDAIVPSDLPEFLRIQLMAFLAWTIKREPGIPQIDFKEISNLYSWAPTFATLMKNHFSAVLRSKTPPPYVRFIYIADAKAKTSEEYARAFLHKFHPMVYDAVPPSITDFSELDPNNILHQISDLHERAKKDNSVWLRLLIYYFNNLRLRGNINHKALGLQQLIYFGTAYRWQHKHVAWAVELEHNRKFNPRFNVLVVPQRSVSELDRIMNIQEIDWTVRAINPELRDSEGQWYVDWNRLMHSIDTKTTLKRLIREYGPKTSRFAVISKEEARYLDFINSGFSVASVGSAPTYPDFTNVSGEEISDTIDQLCERNIVFNLHLLDNSAETTRKQQPLQTILISLRGETEGILSIIRALMRYAPAATPFLTRGGGQAYVLSRLIRDEPRLTDMAMTAKTIGVNVEYHDFKSYRTNLVSLYDRLWIDEGKWDDDLSGLISQSMFKTPK